MTSGNLFVVSVDAHLLADAGVGVLDAQAGRRQDRRERPRERAALAVEAVLGRLALARRQHDVSALEIRRIDRRETSRADAAAREQWDVAARVDEDQRRSGVADDRLLDMFQRLAAAFQGDRRLRREIRGCRHQQVLLAAAGRDREAVPGEVEQRDVRALARLREIRERLLERVEVEIVFDDDREADLFEARLYHFGVDRRIGERRDGVSMVGDDEGDAAAEGDERGR